MKNSNQRTRESKFAEGFRISSEPLVRPDNQQEKVANERDDVGLPRVYGAPILYAIARDPATIFIYWRIDWSSVFANTVPVDRQVHLRVHPTDGVEEKSVSVEPMAGSCDITVSRPAGSYHVEIGYYQPSDVWNSVARSEEVTMPRDTLAGYAAVALATIPLHLSFQRLLDLVGASKGEALAEKISQFQTSALNNEERGQLSRQEREILRAMDISLTEIATARRAFIDEADSDTLRKRTEALLSLGTASPSRGFGESSWG